MLHPISEPISRPGDHEDSHGNPPRDGAVKATSDVLVHNVPVHTMDGAMDDVVNLAASLNWDSPLSNVHWIYQRLNTAFPSAEIQVEDTRGDDQHLAVIIASGAFLEKSRIACHQLVYGALDHMRQGKIHAMSLKTVTKT